MPTVAELLNKSKNNCHRDAEADSVAEVSEVAFKFKESKKAEAARYADAVDGDFLLCAVFQSKIERDEFVRKLNLLKSLDEFYIDGSKLADACGVRLETPVPPDQREKPINKRWSNLVKGVRK